MRSRRSLVIFVGAVAAILLLALLLRQTVTQHEALDDKNVIFQSDYQQSGAHEGDLVVVGSTLNLDGGSSVSGNASLVGNAIRVAGNVDGALTALGKDVSLDPSANIGGDARLMGTTITVAGHVSGDLVANGETVTIAPAAQIDGDISAPCSAQIDDLRETPSKIACSDVDFGLFAPLFALRESGAPSVGQIAPLALLILALIGTLALTGASVLLVTFCPVQISRIEEAMRARPRSYGGVGLATYALVFGLLCALVVALAILPPLGLLLVPVFLLLGLLLLLVSLTGLVTLTLIVGDGLLRRASKLPTPPLIAAVVGSLILSALLAGIALLPFGLAVSFLLLGAINTVGLGAALFTRVGTRPVSRTYFIQG